MKKSAKVAFLIAGCFYFGYLGWKAQPYIFGKK